MNRLTSVNVFPALRTCPNTTANCQDEFVNKQRMSVLMVRFFHFQSNTESLGNNDCDKDNAICEDTKESYSCFCKSGFVDASANATHYPGRVCRKPVKITIDDQHADTALSLDSCDPSHPKCQNNEVCTDRKVKGEFVCDCADNSFRFHDNTCRLFSACESLNTCDKNAQCVSTFDAYNCQCKSGYFDM